MYHTDNNNNKIHSTAIINSNVELGKNNHIGPYCIIGEPAEHKLYWNKETGKVKIGNNNILTGHITIDAGTKDITTLGDNNFLMKHVHLGHDVILEDNITISVGAVVGGHTVIMQGANIGLNATIHQNHLIGSYSMLGMGSIVPKSREVIPFYTYAGNPIKEIGKNQIAIDKNKLSIWDFHNENERYKTLKQTI